MCGGTTTPKFLLLILSSVFQTGHLIFPSLTLMMFTGPTRLVLKVFCMSSGGTGVAQGGFGHGPRVVNQQVGTPCPPPESPPAGCTVLCYKGQWRLTEGEKSGASAAVNSGQSDVEISQCGAFHRVKAGALPSTGAERRA